MTDDQATLESFAEGADDRPTAEDEGAGRHGRPDDGSATTAAPGVDGGAVTTDSTPSVDDELVCPWCLAGADHFVEAGLTGLACGRCSAVLPVDAPWFRRREVVARRPMYAVAAGDGAADE